MLKQVQHKTIMDLKEEIKSRIKILDLVYEFGLQVYRKNFIKSIYKEEQNPSMKIYEDTNTFKCYSTGIQGDVIKFYMDYHRLSFKEALKELAMKAGIEDGKWKMENGRWEKSSVISKQSSVCKKKSEDRSQKAESEGQRAEGKGKKSSVIGQQSAVNQKKEGKQKRKIQRRCTILKSEKEFFDERAGIYEYMMGMDKNKSEIKAMENLMNERKEKQILIYESLEKFCYGVDDEVFDYLLGKDRGLKPETIKKFRLFSVKELKGTIEFLKDCFSIDDLIIAGLMNPKGNFVFTYHKLIIPYTENNKITYLRGRVVNGVMSNEYPANGTGGVRRKGKICKYISLNNFAGNLSLKRFFNIDILKEIFSNEKLIVCEGEFDTMIMVQEGYKAIGIPGVSNIPEDEINLIKNYETYLAFDNDPAGANAMQRFVNLLNKPLKGIKLKHNNDLTELINERNSRENI